MSLVLNLGITQPGMTMVCGDSHTSTHGAFGSIAFGIGTSQVAQVFASQCLLVSKPKSMRIIVNGNSRKVFIQKTSFSTLLPNSVQIQEQATLLNMLVKSLKI